MSEGERLHEAVIRLEEALATERRRRLGAEALLEGVQRLFDARALDELPALLVAVLRDVFECDEAAMLGMSGDVLAPLAATSALFDGTTWRPGKMFRRVLGGHPAAVFDVRRVEEWAAQPEALLAKARAVIHLPLRAGGLTAVLMGARSRDDMFSPRHVELGRRFTRIAEQVMDSLAARHEAEQSRLAGERAKLLEEANADLEQKLDTIRRQQITIDQLSAPVLRIWSGVLVVPIVGDLGDHSTTAIGERLLNAIIEEQARTAILDLTGIDAVDAGTIDRLGKIIRAVELIGARCLLSGVSPLTAMTMVNLDTPRATPFHALADALAAALSNDPRTAPRAGVRR